MTLVSMTELIQSRQQNKSRLVLSIKFMVCPDLTSHVYAKLCSRLNWIL